MMSGTQKNRERGAITVAETLIALAIAASILITWAYYRSIELTNENARQSGRMIATYARAAAEWLSEAPPATPGDYGIGNLQNCADPAGVRYLSCTFSSTSRIPFAFSTVGMPVSMGDLVIRVSLGPTGAAGDIDFGIIRSGADANDDGLPDSRPDLATIAHREASEETGAGVNDFFELVFARTDPTGLVYDPADAAFDQAAIDDLARLQARVGATVNAPFLRTDGTNEMQAGITFFNGVVVSPQASNLQISGGSGLVVANPITATQVTAPAISATATLTVNPTDGVRGAGFDRLDQSQEVIDNSDDIDANQASIATSESNIATNTAGIATNAANIGTNRANIATNAANIGTNRANIATNAANIGTNAAGIATANSRIHTNAADIRFLKNKPDPTPFQPAQCTPTEATVRAGLPAGSRTSAPSGCLPCGRWRFNSSSHTYKVRNLSTLACETRTLNVYFNICLVSNGLCDGYCANGVTIC